MQAAARTRGDLSVHSMHSRPNTASWTEKPVEVEGAVSIAVCEDEDGARSDEGVRGFRSAAEPLANNLHMKAGIMNRK